MCQNLMSSQEELVMSDYPCICDEMKWMIDHNEVFKIENNDWMLVWMELDRSSEKKTNIEKFGVRFSHCMFCGRKII